MNDSFDLFWELEEVDLHQDKLGDPSSLSLVDLAWCGAACSGRINLC